MIVFVLEISLENNDYEDEPGTGGENHRRKRKAAGNLRCGGRRIEVGLVELAPSNQKKRSPVLPGPRRENSNAISSGRDRRRHCETRDADRGPLRHRPDALHAGGRC